jgi:hypothetical protein
VHQRERKDEEEDEDEGRGYIFKRTMDGEDLVHVPGEVDAERVSWVKLMFVYCNRMMMKVVVVGVDGRRRGGIEVTFEGSASGERDDGDVVFGSDLFGGSCMYDNIICKYVDV